MFVSDSSALITTVPEIICLQLGIWNIQTMRFPDAKLKLMVNDL